MAASQVILYFENQEDALLFTLAASSVLSADEPVRAPATLAKIAEEICKASRITTQEHSSCGRRVGLTTLGFPSLYLGTSKRYPTPRTVLGRSDYRVGFNLLSQPPNIHIYRAGRHKRTFGPDGIEQLVAGKHTGRMACQIFQEPEFPCRGGNTAISYLDDHGSCVDFKPSHFQHIGRS